MKKTYNLTNTSIEKLKNESGKEVIYRDAKIDGLQLRHLPSGTKTFRLFLIKNKTRINESIGMFPAVKIEIARQKAIEMLANIDDLIQEKNNITPQSKLTFRALFDYYINEHSIPFNTPDYTHSVKLMFNRYLSQWQYCDLPYYDINRNCVLDLLKSESIEGKNRTRDKVYGLIQVVLNTAVQFGVIDRSPIPPKIIRKHAINKRTRILKKEEIHRILDSANQEINLYHRLFFHMLFCLPARLNNVLQMRWDAIDYELNTLTIKDEDSKIKDGKDYVLPLTPRALNLLTQLQKIRINDYVFPSSVLADKPIQNIHKAWERVRDRTGLTNVVMHDFRRTQETAISSAGANDHILRACIDHAPPAGAISHYVHPHVDDIRKYLIIIQDQFFDDNYFD